MTKVISIIIIILAISFTSCKVQEVQVGDMNGFRIENLNKQSVDFKFNIPIKNTNNFKFKIIKANLDVKIEGKDLGTIKDINKIKVPANSNATYPFIVTVNFSEVVKNSPGFLPSLMFKRKLDLSIKGHIKARAFLIMSKKFEVDEKKPISLF